MNNNAHLWSTCRNLVTTDPQIEQKEVIFHKPLEKGALHLQRYLQIFA